MSRREVSDSNCIRPCVDEPALQELRKEALANDHLVALAAFMTAAGSDTRMRMLYVLWKGGERCGCDLADIFEITTPAVSRHLKILREKALVQARRDSQTIYYSLCMDNPFTRMLVRLFEEQERGQATPTVHHLRQVQR